MGENEDEGKLSCAPSTPVAHSIFLKWIFDGALRYRHRFNAAAAAAVVIVDARVLYLRPYYIPSVAHLFSLSFLHYFFFLLLPTFSV